MMYEPIKHFPSDSQKVKELELKIERIKILLKDPISDYLALYKIRELLGVLPKPEDDLKQSKR